MSHHSSCGRVVKANILKSTCALCKRAFCQWRSMLGLNKQIKHRSRRKTDNDAHSFYEKTFWGHRFPSRRIPTNINCFSPLNISVFQAKWEVFIYVSYSFWCMWSPFIECSLCYVYVCRGFSNADIHFHSTCNVPLKGEMPIITATIVLLCSPVKQRDYTLPD